MNEKIVPSIRLLCKETTLNDQVQEYIFKRIKKLEKFSKNILEYEVEVKMDKKGKFTVEIMVKTPYNLYRVVKRSESIEGSTDMAVDEIKDQIVRDKDKVKELRERGARSIKKKAVLAQEARFR